MNTETTPPEPKWLKRTQQASWEPEILISGIVLLALTQVPRLLDGLHFYLEERTSMFYFYTSNVDDVVISALKVSTYWLMIGLVLHLVMRSVWVSFVGLSYLFPKGIQHEKLQVQPWFEARLRRLPDFKTSVMRLEDICSAMYATAFLFVMATLALCCYMLFMTFLALVCVTFFPGYFDANGMMDRWLSVLTLLVAVPYLLDFLTLGWLKRLPVFWKVYRPVYVFMSFITFATVYRGIYYGLVTNVNRWKFFALLAVYTAATSYMVLRETTEVFKSSEMMFNSIGTATYDGYYRNTVPRRYSTWGHIQSETIDNGVLELFLPHKTQYEKYVLENCPKLLEAKGIADTFDSDNERNLACLVALYNLYIDGTELVPQRFHMRELNHTGQFGLFTWIDISHLDKGLHLLQIHVNLYGWRDEQIAEIPFYNNNAAVSRSFFTQPIPEVNHGAEPVPVPDAE